MTSIETISIMIAAINQIYTSRQANEQRKRELETRQAELFMQIYNRWTDKDMAAAYGLTRFQYTKEWETPEEAFEKIHLRF